MATQPEHFPFPGEDAKEPLTKPVKLAKREKEPVALAQANPWSLIQLAVSQNADIAKLEKLMELQMRWEANEAKKAFVAAMNAFKSDLPQILKNRHVKYTTSKGITEYDHATIDQVCDALIPSLSKYGLYHRWKIAQENGRIRVTCVITHDLGHSEETSMEAGPDDSGNKNAIQAISSSTTYLERYTFLAATGTAAKGTDTDGVEIWESLPIALEEIKNAETVEILGDVFRKWFKEATGAKNFNAMQAIVKSKDLRKAELLKDEPAQ